jgi:hypothetical protein
LSTVILMLLACASFSTAAAAEMANGCRLKGGSLVQLAAGACTMEGGTPVTAAATVAAIAATAKFSDDPKLAAAQRSVVELLNRTVVEKDTRIRNPEGVERAAKFDGCRLIVDENMHVDHGNLFSARMNFKIASTVDLRNVGRDSFGVLGATSSIGGRLKAHAVYFEERKRKDGNNIAISVLEQSGEGDRRYTMPGLAAYWDAPRDDLWMADEYGYPKGTDSGNVATDKIRILFIVNTADETAALKQALDDVHALCKP